MERPERHSFRGFQNCGATPTTRVALPYWWPPSAWERWYQDPNRRWPWHFPSTRSNHPCYAVVNRSFWPEWELQTCLHFPAPTRRFRPRPNPESLLLASPLPAAASIPT